MIVGFCVCVFFQQIQVGLVYNSVLDEMYTAIKGKGAYLNGKKITASKETGTTLTRGCRSFKKHQWP